MNSRARKAMLLAPNVRLMAQYRALEYGSVFEIRPAADLNEMMKAI